MKKFKNFSKNKTQPSSPNQSLETERLLVLKQLDSNLFQTIKTPTTDNFENPFSRRNIIDAE